MGNKQDMKKKIKQALISVSDKSNLKSILRILNKYKIKIISSGGTYKEIKKLGYYCREVSEFTKSPEILEGRIKTLHPKIYGGILSIRNNKIHQRDMRKNKFEEIDLVIVNFYPFENTLAKTQNHKIIVENIDIGGPTMVRAAAKNYRDTTIITSTNQYENLIIELEKNKGSTKLEYREKLSEEAFSATAYYDSVISNYLNIKTNNIFPEKKIFHGNLIQTLRYGENPHQKAAIYSTKKELGILQLHGKKLSYNNYNDIFSALNLSKTLPENLGTVIVKHANPCGVSINKNKVGSYKEALACDPISAFGGIVSCNFKINKEVAMELGKIFLEVVIGIRFEKEALKILKKKKNLRIIDAANLKLHKMNNIISNFNSLLVQNSDNKIFSKKDFKVVSIKKPSQNTFNNLIFAFNVCRNVKSNAIVLVKDKSTIGIGSGQPSRLDSCKIAIEKMNKFQKIKNNDEIIAASDAFFPFIDGIETLVQEGVRAVIQPYGSIKDKEIIKFANQTETILVFSKTRHFKH
jgi:phosphoribosylaminoimidazolecarboxamide formyltransferase/IMP cyclohydrolase